MNGPDVPTPVTDGTYLYVINDRGIMWCLDAKTGAPFYERQRLRPSTYTGSPVLADGKIYITNEDGVTSVVQAGPKFAVLAENDLGEYTLSSPAGVGRADLHSHGQGAVCDREAADDCGSFGRLRADRLPRGGLGSLCLVASAFRRIYPLLVFPLEFQRRYDARTLALPADLRISDDEQAVASSDHLRIFDR